MAPRHKKIVFPQDELKHDHGVEWWYFNGHLADADGNEYAFMHCLFRTDIRKFKTPLEGVLPPAPFYFSNAIVTDIGRKKAYPHINHAAMITKDSFQKKLLHVHYVNPIPLVNPLETPAESSIIETEPFAYEIHSEQLDIRLVAQKPPILLGNNGYVQLKDEGTYYYSLPRLAAEGSVMIGKRRIDVKGIAWMDHQWANPHFSQDGWTWFSIQLEDKTDLVCFTHHAADGDTHYAHISLPDGLQTQTTDLSILPIGNRWTSRKTGTSYPLEWRVEIPEHKIALTVAPRIKDQEMIVGMMHYWEGPLAVSGTIGGKKVAGLGFAELVGYRSRYSNLEFVKAIAAHTIKTILPHS